MTWPTPPDWIYAPSWYRMDRPKRKLVHPSFLVRLLFGAQSVQRLAWGASQYGYPLPAYLLAHYLNMGYKGEPAHAAAVRAIRNFKSRKAINAVWQAWLENRSPELERILLAHKQPLASEPLEVRTMCLLKLGHERLLARISAEQVPVIVDACRDPDLQIARQARDTLLNLKGQETIAAFCQLWQRSPTPLLNDILINGKFTPSLPEARVYKALAANTLDVIPDIGKDAVDPLIQSLDDQNKEIADRARFCLLNLRKMDAVNHFCARWYHTRRPDLEKCLLQALYLASGPPEVRLATILKNGRVDLARQVSPEAVIGLVAAIEDADPTIRDGACQVIPNLQKSETRQALLQHLIAAEHPLAQEKALQAGYLPDSPDNRALYLFLTGQWEQYESLDFDQRLLQTTFAASPDPLRKRIAQTVQRSGRVAYLKILTGFDQELRRGNITAQNAEVLFRILTANQEWEQLWKLASELPLDWSIHIPPVLVQNGWQPESASELELFNRLIQLAAPLTQWQSAMENNKLSLEIQNSLPPAVSCAKLKVSGRANTVTFSPSRPQIAVGTGNRKVVTWNYRFGAVDTVYSGFNHSIGSSAFTPAGRLVVGEKTNQKISCGVYLCENAHPILIYEHAASITGLAALDHQEHILTAGRDQALILYDLAGQRVISRRSHHDWGRSVCVSPNDDLIALLHKTISIFQLPDLQYLPLPVYFTGQTGSTGTAQQAAFLPEGDRLIVGSYNGQVAHYQIDHKSSKLVHTLFTSHAATITGCEVLPARKALITASADGVLRFFHIEEQAAFASLNAAVDRLTSIQVSSGGDFLAAGAGDGSITLWDLRALELIDYLAEPLSTYPLNLLAALNVLLEHAVLPSTIQNALEYIRLVLQHRVQFDIQIDQLTTIRPGEFDIIID